MLILYVVKIFDNDLNFIMLLLSILLFCYNNFNKKNI